MGLFQHLKRNAITKCCTKRVTRHICIIQGNTEVSLEEAVQEKVDYNTVLPMIRLDLMIQKL